MSKYIYQKFLLQCDYEKLDIESIPSYRLDLKNVMPFDMEFCIFDLDVPVVRKIDISEMDSSIDTEEDWMKFVARVSELDELIICDRKEHYKNPIICEYRMATLQAYLYRLQHSDIKTKVYYQKD